MSDKQAFVAGADAQQLFLNNQINLFLFDLKNEASEHGFKANESWALQLATEEEILSLKRLYYPVVSLRLQPDDLLKVFQEVKNKLQQSLSKDDVSLTESDLAQNDKRHLAAYPLRSIRK